MTLDDIFRRHISEHRTALYAWVKTLISIASTVLTGLVALQKYYIPVNPSGLQLLKVCWGALALCIAGGVVALYGESATSLRAAIELQDNRLNHGDAWVEDRIREGVSTIPRRIFLISQAFLPYLFVLAMGCLAAFAVLNIDSLAGR